MKIKTFVGLAIAIAVAGSFSLHAETKKKSKFAAGAENKKGKSGEIVVPGDAVIAGEVAPLKILSRAQWKANEPVQLMTPHRAKYITIHHTAIKQNPKKSLKDKMQTLQEFSQHEGTLASGKKKPVWADVPYHFYIAVNGEVAEGRNIGFVGDTNTEYDPTGHVLVTLEGNFETDEVTKEQMATAIQLVIWLAQKYKVGPEMIKAHRDYAQTACPGKKLYNRVNEIRKAVKKSL